MALYTEGTDDLSDENGALLPLLNEGETLKLLKSSAQAAFYTAASPLYGGHTCKGSGGEGNR